MASNDLVKLPENLPAFQKCFPGLTFEEILDSSKNSDEFSPEQNVIRKYSGGALLAGRPLNSTMIFVCGISDVEVRHMIKILFDIPVWWHPAHLDRSFESIRLIQKQLKVYTDKPPIIGNLNFVDVSDPFCSNDVNNAWALGSIRNFATNCSALAARKGLATKIREITYPNIVILAVPAIDKRLSGPDCLLRKSLHILKNTTQLIDVRRSNLIIVVTNAMSYDSKSRSKEKFIKTLSENSVEIREMVFEIIGIKEVEVVPIENEEHVLNEYKLQKSGDYYLLPDGQPSHANVFQAMLRRFDKNEDHLGRSFVSWYANQSYPEREDYRPEIVVPPVLVSKEDTAFAEHILANFYHDEPKEITWLSRENGETAPYAVIGGHDQDNNNIYVNRATHEGVTIPGKLDYRQSQAYITFGGVEHKKDSYEVLIVPQKSTQWEPCRESKIHPDAIVGGWDDQGGKYYIGRVFHNDLVTCGMVHPTDGCCYISSDGLEYSYDLYDVLIKIELEEED